MTRPVDHLILARVFKAAKRAQRRTARKHAKHERAPDRIWLARGSQLDDVFGISIGAHEAGFHRALLVIVLAPFLHLRLVLDTFSLALELLLLELLGSGYGLERLPHKVENNTRDKPDRRARVVATHHADKRHDRRGEEGHRKHQPKRSAQKPSDENDKVLSGTSEAITRDREQDKSNSGTARPKLMYIEVLAL